MKNSDPEITKEASTKEKINIARWRIGLLFDEGTFEEIGAGVVNRSTDFGLEKKQIPGDGVITGWGKINGRTVFLFSQDFMDYGGALGEVFAKKMKNNGKDSIKEVFR